MKRTLMLTLLVAALAGCETVGGFGQDVEAGGEAIQQTSNQVQSDM